MGETFLPNDLVRWGIDLGTKIISAIVLWLLGRWIIALGVRFSRKALHVRHFDATIVTYVSSSLDIVLTLLMTVSLLGMFGVETTSFAALFAAAGVAIGVAWAGLLSHFAAGVFLLFIRPFKIGDMVKIGGETGVVREIGLIGTTLSTGDNVAVIVPNNKIFGDTIHNFNANEYRRATVRIKVPHHVAQEALINIFKARVAVIPNVLDTFSVTAEVVKIKRTGVIFNISVACRNVHHTQVLFDTHRVVNEIVQVAIKSQ
jgi:small conductance mechanosensitive channel